MQSGEREPRVRELRGPVVVVNEVESSGGRVAHLPAGRQRAGGGGPMPQVGGHARVVPRGRARRRVVEVHLPARRRAHLCGIDTPHNQLR